MLSQIESLPELIRNELEPLDQRVMEILAHAEIRAARNLVVTGCGDSFFAGLAAELSFSSLAHLPAQAIPAMKAARFSRFDLPGCFPPKNLVLAISVSGTVARTIEAVKVSRSVGAMTVGITADPTSPLAQTAEHVLNCSIPAFLDSPGVRTFRISLMTLYLLAIRLGELNGRLAQDEGVHLRSKLTKTADAIERSLEKLDQQTRTLAHQLTDRGHFVFVGHGPNYGTALFSAAKVIEAAGRSACGQDTEEWAHLQYFIRGQEKTPTFLISPPDQGQERFLELLEPMRRTGKWIVTVAPEAETGFTGLVDWQLPIRGKVAPIFPAMVYPMAAEMFAAHLADILGESYFGRSREAYQLGHNTIRSSQILEPENLHAHWMRQTETEADTAWPDRSLT